MGEAKHECGIGAVYLKNAGSKIELPFYLINLGFAMQARGQRSAGITCYNPSGKKILSSHKGIGLVKDVFRLDDIRENKEILEKCKGIAGIVHTRYSTSGDDSQALDETQPFERRHSRRTKRFAIAFNGNLANHQELRKNLLETGHWLDLDVDTEVLMNLLALAIKEELASKETPDWAEVIKRLVARIDGAFNIVILLADGTLLVFRDPRGFHPLMFGGNEELFAFASESAALERIGIKKFEDVEPGELFIIKDKELTRKKLFSLDHKHCHFEHVYFARSRSVIDGVYIREARAKLGETLAEAEPLKEKLNSDFIVVPAPWTALPAAQAYAKKLGLDFRVAVEKKENIRGFINSAITRKRMFDGGLYDVHRYDVKGKKILLIDDSLVRGETAKLLVKEILEGGAVEVHLRLTEPIIKCPCFYGIDYPTISELAINRFNGDVQQLGDWLGVKSLGFQTIDGLAKGLGISKDHLCIACLTGEYPTEAGKKRYEQELNKKV